jgi:hypothetical protein
MNKAFLVLPLAVIGAATFDRVSPRQAASVAVMSRSAWRVGFARSAQLESDTTAVCVPSAAVAASGDTIGLAAAASPWTDPQFSWTVSHGQILGNGARVRWVVAAGALGMDSATAKITSHGSAVATCSARVFVLDRGQRGTSDLIARTFWLPSQRERAGYGLYSYLLLAAPPADSAARSRYRTVISEVLRVMPALTDLEDHLAREDTLRRREFNVAYIPVTKRPTRADRDTVAAVLAAYDYARARVLLSAFPGNHGDGVYLVAVREPLARHPSVSGSFLQQNLSVAPSRLVPIAVRAFLDDAAQQDLGQHWSAQHAMVRLRTTIGVMAEGLPAVRGALTDWRAAFREWVSWKDDGAKDP